MSVTLSRRDFIRAGAVVGGGLSLGFSLTGCAEAPYPHHRPGGLQTNAFLQILPDDRIIFQVHKVEMGQGNMTGLPMVVAEELEVDPAAMTLEQAGIHPDFADPKMHLQVTGGSAAMANSYDILRKVGATAREMLLAAAAAEWKAPRSELTARNGRVVWENGARQASYGELADAAARQPVPDKPSLKDPSQFTVIGKPMTRLDALDKVTGRARFGIDSAPAEALTAVIVRCPYFGGSLQRFDPSAAQGISGVEQIFRLNDAVVVLAADYHQASKAAQAVEVDWSKGASPADTDTIFAELHDRLGSAEAENVRDDGEPGSEPVARTVRGVYQAPYLAHATMEPMNAVADCRDGKCTVWAGVQTPDVTRAMLSAALGLPREAVTVHVTLLGGGFGRRLMPDFAVEAALISQKAGKPVQLIWSREEDTRHDYYRPCSVASIEADVTDTGTVRWRQKIACPSIYSQAMPMFISASLPGWAPSFIPRTVGKFIAAKDDTSTEGAADMTYGFETIKVDYIEYTPPVPIGFWRSVGHSQNAFMVESFVDEVAHALGEDPVAFRRRHLQDDPALGNVLDTVADRAGWGAAQPGRFKGVAVQRSFDTAVAEVVECSVDNGRIRVHRVWCAVDCGRAVNPDIVRMQMESGIVFALTAALMGEITIADGAVRQGNFDTYPMVRMSESPLIDVVVVDSDKHPTGVGEPGTPPLAPALANAVFAATGKRLRSLPLRLEAPG